MIHPQITSLLLSLTVLALLALIAYNPRHGMTRGQSLRHDLSDCLSRASEWLLRPENARQEREAESARCEALAASWSDCMRRRREAGDEVKGMVKL